MSLYYSTFLMFFFSICTASQVHKQCADLYNCVQCLRNPKCGWCSQIKTREKGSLSAVCLESELIEDLCEPGFYELPKNVYTILRDLPMKESRDGDSVQMKPQKVALKIRPGTNYTIDFKFKKASDYPIDIYYLLDFSKSMQEYKKQLSRLGEKLAIEMEKMTSSLQLGFGSFVDKVAFPFTDTRPEFLKNPCSGCVAPYSFKNHLALTNKTRVFSTYVSEARMSINQDTPEGGFDGLMQVMVCSKEINWRSQSRKIIVFCTDAPFHVAGDGKLVGVVEPNDGQCHLNTEGEYTHSLILDYPSIGHIKAKAEELNMNIIFAVTEFRLSTYTYLKNAIDGASVGALKNDIDVINLVINNYKNLSLSLSLTDNATEVVKMDYFAKCQPDVWDHAAECYGVKQGDEIDFKVNIIVTDCTEPEQIIEIKPIGISDSLIIQLSVYCSCECDHPSSKIFDLNSETCNDVGNLTCGRCSCPENYEGKKCECEKKVGRRTTSIGLEGCTRNDIICSNRGTCVCGECQCIQPKSPNSVVSGDFCECDNFSCPGTPSLCSGRGECQCGECVCDAGWQGISCDCPLERYTCRDPDDPDGVECSGRGQCVCGKCECDTKEMSGKIYKGAYCERCIDCKIKCTPKMNLCIDCLVHKSKEAADSKCSRCSEMFKNVTSVSDASDMLNVSDSSVLCQPLEPDENGCSYRYVAYYSNDELWALADSIKTCPDKLKVIGIAAGVVGSTLLAGLIMLIIWKVITTVHDKREFEKFEKQRQDTQWGRGENPLFRKAVTTHMNPAFIGTEKDD